MHHCLSKDQVDQIVELPLDEFKLGKNPSEFEMLLYECVNWQRELICLTYFLSKAFEVKSKQGDHPTTLVNKLRLFLSMSEQIWLTFQEIDSEFIDYLYRHTKDESLSLEATLVQIQDWLTEHRYV